MTPMFMKLLSGEELTDEDRVQMKKEDVRMSMIRFMVMEKLNSGEGPKIDNFRFTPGPNWMEVPMVDMVNTLIESSSKIEDLEVVNLVD